MGAKTPLSLIVIIYHNRLTSGVRDMVPHLRCPHERTAYGTCLLHISPESYVGGPLALVQVGDAISLDIPNRKLDLLVSEVELKKRLSQWKPNFAILVRQHGRGALPCH
jgi:hypothetical protein